MSDNEQLGKFYLGRKHDLASRETSAEPLLYDSKDLTTHAVCVGMTGSGKTGLCVTLLEEAALDGVPAIVIDPKGDLGNLLLTFPELTGEEFRPWIDESAAARKGMSADEFAASQAELWRTGLAKWGEGPERIRRYQDSVERTIYTPGSSAGIPLTILKSFAAPPPEIVADGDAFRERVASSASGVLALLGIDADPVRSREHIFLSNVLDTAWRARRDLDIPQLIREIQQPPFDKVGIMDLETFFPGGERTKLSMSLNNLLASPSFASWMEGEPLNVQRLLYTADGRPRLSILSIAHLGDAERMFFVTILLGEVITWMRQQSGTSSLRALLYMDEIFGYFPPVGEPPTKRPMLTLMKQARAFGLGCVLATQNPVDLDYKGLSNAGTWFLGRLQTERDKARVLEGLEGASAQAGASFNRQQMEQTLAGLGSRVFLMNNVHDDQPAVFHTRWALSYLGGPMTRGQIKTLMDPVRDRFATSPAANESAGDPLPDGVENLPPSALRPPPSSRPVLAASIAEEFLSINERVPDGWRILYRPGLLGSGKVHFVRSSCDVDTWRECVVLQSFHHGSAPDDIWDGAYVYEQDRVTDDQPATGADFDTLPTELAREKSYKIFERHLKDHLYRTEAIETWECEAIDAFSQDDEPLEDFRIRIGQRAREERDREREAAERKHQSNRSKLAARVDRYTAERDAQRSQFWGKVVAALMTIVDLAFSAFAGKATRRRSTSSMSKARQAATERGQQTRAQAKLDEALAALQQLDADHEHELAELERKFDPANLQFDRIEIKPRKSDIVVNKVVLAWLPSRVSPDGTAEPVY
jgi:hypothetical protein